MLLVAHGTDTKKTSDKASELLALLEEKRPDAEVFRVDLENFSQEQFEELLGGQGLFERKIIALLSGLCGDKEVCKYVLEFVDELAASENAFIVREGKLLKRPKTKLESAAEKVYEYNEKKKGGRDYNVFAISGAVAERNPKKGWVAYQEALRSGAAPEEIHGAILWQIKALVQSVEAGSAKEAGLKPFAYKKAKGYLKHWSKNDLLDMYHALVDGYHRARRGEWTLEDFLEREMLKLRR